MSEDHVRCASCGHDNPDINRFCGMCGSILDRRRLATSANVVPMPSRVEDTTKPGEMMAATEARDEHKPEHLSDEHFSAPAAQVYPREHAPFSIFGVDTGEPMRSSGEPQGLHGPSFLGLGDSGGNGDYLLEDEESHGGRKFLLFVALLIVGGLAYLQYQADTPVTSIWAAIKSRATGEAAQQKPAPQEPNANGVQPTQPTSDKGDSSQQSNNAQTPAGNAQSASTSENPSTSDQNKPDTAESRSNSPEKSAAQDKTAAANADENPPAASATKTPQTTQAEKPRKNSAELMAKAQRPQSDRDTAAGDQQGEEAAPAKRGKPSPDAESRSDRADDALVARAQGYLYGKGGRQSCNTALSLLKQAAERGNAKADSQLGAMYATGNCAPFDRAEAYRWFSKAAEADPGNSYLQRSRDMMWREMSPQERRKVLE